MNNKIYCPECEMNVSWVSWDKDDPVLSCGHTKRYDNDINEGLKTLFHICFDNRTAYCPVCKAIVSTRHDKGRMRCSGNLLDNPGCGTILKTASANLKVKSI